MKLTNLNQLIKKKITESDLTKTEMADALGLTVSHFNYRYQNGILEWNEIAKLKKIGLPVTLREFSEAMSKDLNAPVTVRRPRA